VAPLWVCGALTSSYSPVKLATLGLDVVLLQNVDPVGGMLWGYLETYFLFF